MQDIRFAWRSLRATPVVTAAVVLSLGLGIGANTAIFSLIDRILLRSLPVAHPDRLAIVSTANAWRYRPALALATFDAIRANAPFADRVIAVGTCCGRSAMRLGGDMVPVDRLFVSGDFFDTLGIRAAAGRLLTPDDDRLSAKPPAGVMSARFWKARFARDPAVIGRAIYLDGAPVTIVGVVPEEFFGIEVGRSFDVALPIEREHQILPATPFDRNVPWLNIVLRLKPGVSIRDAANALRAAQPRIRDLARPPDGLRASFMAEPLTLESAATGVSALRERFAGTLAVLLGLVVMVLAIACVNVSNIQLARAAARRHEVGVLSALGASRWRIVRARLVESAMLAAAGGLAGLFFAQWAATLLTRRLSTAATPVFLDVAIDGRLLAFAAAAVMLTTIAAGLWPACRSAWVQSPVEALKMGGAGGIGGGGALSSMLVIGQIGVALVMVIAATLCARTLAHLTRAPLGYDRDRVLVAAVTAGSVPASERNRLYHRMVESVAAVPGVGRAGGSLGAPFVTHFTGDVVVSAVGTLPPPDAEKISQINEVTTGWLEAYGLRVLRGRTFDGRDGLSTARVMIVNDAFIRRILPDGAVGETLTLTGRLAVAGDVPLGNFTIVGVVSDSVFNTVRERTQPAVYLPMAQDDSPLLLASFYIGARSAVPPATLVRSVTEAIARVSPDASLTVTPLSTQIDESLAQDRALAWVASFFGGLALVLAALGLYGVTAHSVTQRRREIGLRVALGASPAAVVWLVLIRVAAMVAVGVTAGVACSAWVATMLGSLLFGVNPRDPVTLGACASVLAASAFAAGAVPAWRASRVDPAAVLRAQ